MDSPHSYTTIEVVKNEKILEIISFWMSNSIGNTYKGMIKFGRGVHSIGASGAVARGSRNARAPTGDNAEKAIYFKSKA